MSIRLSLMIAMGALLSATTQAAPITWTMDNAVIGGSTVTGSFVFDADTSTFSDISITTTSGSIIPNTTWTNIALFNTSSALLPFVDTTSSNETGADLLDLFLSSPLTDGGGYDPFTMALAGTCAAPTCLIYHPYPGDTGIESFSGGVIAGRVPEPATLSLVGLCLASIGFARRRRAI